MGLPQAKDFIVLFVYLDGNVSEPLRELDHGVNAGEACTNGNDPH